MLRPTNSRHPPRVPRPVAIDLAAPRLRPHRCCLRRRGSRFLSGVRDAKSDPFASNSQPSSGRNFPDRALHQDGVTAYQPYPASHEKAGNTSVMSWISAAATVRHSTFNLFNGQAALIRSAPASPPAWTGSTSAPRQSLTPPGTDASGSPASPCAELPCRIRREIFPDPSVFDLRFGGCHRF